jgi:hypothetical protein
LEPAETALAGKRLQTCQLLGNGTINSDETMKTSCQITNGSTAGNAVLYAVSTDNYVIQQQKDY